MMDRCRKNQRNESTEKRNFCLPASSPNCIASDESSTSYADNADGKCFVKTKLTYGSAEAEPGALSFLEIADVSPSVESVTKKMSVRAFSKGPDVIFESLPLASLNQRESSRIWQQKCQMHVSRINQLENELLSNAELHKVVRNELKAECDRMRSERDISFIDLGKRILDSFDQSVSSNDSWTDVGCEESTADCPSLSPAGDQRAERQNLRLNLFKNSCMCKSVDSTWMDRRTLYQMNMDNENGAEPFDDLTSRSAGERNTGCRAGRSVDNLDVAGEDSFTSKNVCLFCTTYSECVHTYLENDDHDRNLLLHQLLAELTLTLQERTEYSEKLNSENLALELKVTQYETALQQQRDSISSRNIHGELFEECTRLRWRVLELEKNTKLSAERILLEAPSMDSAYGSVEISVDPEAPFSAIPSTRRRGYRIRKSINGLQTSNSPIPNSHSSSSSSSFTSTPVAPPSVKGAWDYGYEEDGKDVEAVNLSKGDTNSHTNSHTNTNSQCSEPSVTTTNVEIEEILKIQSELQDKLSCLVLDQERNSQKNVDQKIEHHIRISKQKLKDEIREKINLKEKIAVQLEFEEKEKEQKENEISNCIQMDYLMEKVRQLMHLHDAKEFDYKALIRDLEEQVRTLSYQLYFALGSTQEGQAEMYDPSYGFEGECCGEIATQGSSAKGGDGTSGSNNGCSSSSSSRSKNSGNSSSSSSSSGGHGAADRACGQGGFGFSDSGPPLHVSQSSQRDCDFHHPCESPPGQRVGGATTDEEEGSRDLGDTGAPPAEGVPGPVSTDSHDYTDFTDFEHCTNVDSSSRYSMIPRSFNTLLCSTSFSSTTTSPAASSVNNSPYKGPCESKYEKNRFSAIGLSETSDVTQ